MAECHLAIGKHQSQKGDLLGAETSLSAGRVLLERLVASHPDSAPCQATLASCLSELGTVQGQCQSGDQGLVLLQQAEAIQQQLTERFPGDAKYEKKLAEIINVLGFVHFKRHDYTAALDSFERVKAICKALLDRITSGPKPVRLLDLLRLPTTTSAKSV